MPSSLPTVLVVEDDQLILLNARLVLENAGYGVVAVADGGAALEVLATRPDLVAVLTDIVMPGPIDGLALAWRIHAQRPGLPVFLISGSVRPSPGVLPPGVSFLAKPYRAANLVALLAPRPMRCAS